MKAEIQAEPINTKKGFSPGGSFNPPRLVLPKKRKKARRNKGK